MEILLPIFLLSGQFKSYLNFFGFELPVDLTILVGFFVVALTVWRLYRSQKLATRQITYVGIGLLLIFYGWLIFTLFYTSSEEYSQTKTIYFALNVIAFAVPLVYGGLQVRKFIRWFTLLTLALSASLLPFQYFNLLDAAGTGTVEAFEAIEGLYLSLSGYLGLLVVLFLTAKEPVWKSKLIDWGYVLLLLLLLMLLGARGPILFALFVFLLYYLYNLKVLRLAIGQKTVQAIIFTGLGIFVLMVLLIQFDATRSLLFRTFGRFFSLIAGVLTEGATDASSMVRLALYQDAINGIFDGLHETLFGYGIGSFGIETFGEDIRLYPHNMILEIWFETGLIGLIIFSSWVVYLLTNTVKLPYRHISYWLLVYFFLNLMKSSSLVDIRTEFAFFGLYIVQHFTNLEAPTVIPAEAGT